MIRLRVFAVTILFALLGCESLPPESMIEGGPCENSIARIDVEFSGGAMNKCGVIGENGFYITISPEIDPPINPSPWYSMRVMPKQAGELRLVLDYTESEHRYAPKISRDMMSWQYLDPRNVRISRTGKRVTTSISVDEETLFLSAQELFTEETYSEWFQQLSSKRTLERRPIGNSVEGRPIDLFTSSSKFGTKKSILLVGRQHPPEVTGALTMVHFVNTLMDDTKLAQDFRDQFNVLFVPFMNPDGVEHGYWRLNVNGIDLNRDWGPFTQPETQSVKRLLDELEYDAGHEMLLFLDFHSTKRNVFYTQTVEDEPTEYDFTGSWLENSRVRLPDYDFSRAERHNSDLATSKNYMHPRFQIPAITYETGDETDRDEIHQSATVFAEEMMKLLLEHHSEK